ncbi:MAG TPA: exopolysaccharide transport family protein [Hyphomicrobiaceae bacterium]|nr:exopolysaccharide transport family protein [Hyphomicrobiaceae bacterium]
MSTPRAAATDDIDLGSVVRAIGRKLARLVLLAGIVGAATAGVLGTMAPRYLSQTQLEIRGGALNDAQGRPDKEAVGTHVRAIMSTDIALQMAKELGLAKRPDFNSALEPPDLFSQTLRKAGLGLPKPHETDEDRLLQAYYRQVRAYQVRETRSVIIDCTTSDAKFSAECANRLAELYRASLKGRAVTENDDLRTTLGPQVERLTREVAAAEAEALQFRGQANLFQGGLQSTQLKDQQLGELTAELTRTATARAEIEARAAAARDMLRRGTAAANTDVQKSSLIPRLEESRVRLESQISELSATLLPAHPRMRQLSSELSGLQRQIRDEVEKVVQSLSNDARIAADREAAVRRRIDDMKKTVVASAGDTARLGQIENTIRAKRAELERVQRQYEAAASTAKAGSVQPEVEIVSRAFASNEKIFPKVGTMSALAAFSAFILGLAFTAMREIALGGSRVGPRAPANLAPAAPDHRISPTLSAIPVEAAELQPPAPFEPKAMSANNKDRPLAPDARLAPVTSDNVSASVIEVAARLIAQPRTGNACRTLLTGRNPLVDGIAEALELVRALAASGRRSLLVSWTEPVPGLAASSPGMAELLAGSDDVERAISALPNSSAHVVGPGMAAATEPDGVLASAVLDAFDEAYDHVIVTAPHDLAQRLFAAMEGRFDAGVLVSDKRPDGPDRSFLGFEVPDFAIIPLVRGQRLAARGAGVPSSTLVTRPFAARG